MKNKSFKELIKQSEYVLASVEEEFKNSLKRAEKKLKEKNQYQRKVVRNYYE